ncbi:MAG: glycosyltransferase family 25 protein [Pseudomonadota bacterium]
MQSFVIHMSSATARRANVDKLLRDLPGAEVMEAARGAGQTAGAGDVHRPRYPFKLRAGEIGCFLSHRACWQAIVDRGLPGALIAEDDLSLARPWDDARALLEDTASSEHFIRLPAKAREKGPKVATRGAARLMLPRVIGLQTVFQYVGRDAATRLLAASIEIDRPVDTFLQMHWVHGQRIHTILPNGVSELTAKLGGSTIQTKPRASSVLAREWKRFAYRRAVRARPQQP